MEQQKSIGVRIALVTGILLVLGGAITVLVIHLRRKGIQQYADPVLDLEAAMNQASHGEATTSNPGFTSQQIKTMQQFLLQLGIQHNNQYIIDAIQLTGGIDGKIGSGFHAAVREAKERGYLEGYEDLLRRLGY